MLLPPPPGPSSPTRPEEVDRTLQRQDSGVESALLYAKSWSKYTKELLSWVEKRVNTGRRSENYKNVMFILRTPGIKLQCLACFDDFGCIFWS